MSEIKIEDESKPKELFIPLLFWPKESASRLTSVLTPETIRRINILGSYPFPEETSLSLWDRRRLALNIHADCACCAEDVDACYTDWYTEPEILEAKLVGKNKGATDIIKKHFHVISDLTPEATEILCEFMTFTTINEHRFYQPTFLMMRYNLTYEEAMTILEHCNQQRWMEHGSGARSSWMTNEGLVWCTEHIKVDIATLEHELEEWCKANNPTLK